MQNCICHLLVIYSSNLLSNPHTDHVYFAIISRNGRLYSRMPICAADAFLGMPRLTAVVFQSVLCDLLYHWRHFVYISSNIIIVRRSYVSCLRSRSHSTSSSCSPLVIFMALSWFPVFPLRTASLVDHCSVLYSAWHQNEQVCQGAKCEEL